MHQLRKRRIAFIAAISAGWTGYALGAEAVPRAPRPDDNACRQIGTKKPVCEYRLNNVEIFLNNDQIKQLLKSSEQNKKLILKNQNSK
jgi:hypothetical protein